MGKHLSLRKLMVSLLIAAIMMIFPLAHGNAGALTAQAAPVAVTNGYYTVNVESGYLALRNAMAYDYNNEIGKLYNGQAVVLNQTTGTSYWYVYAPSLGMYGYVNADYLIYGGTFVSTSGNYAVNVQSGYLALRNAMAYDYSNEIGRLYNGQYVQYISTGNSDYWYVYAPSLGKYGYVNRNYLVATGYNVAISGTPYMVQVSSGYLALRNAMAYDYSNEIGKLYTGSYVYVLATNTGSSDYWYVYAPSLGLYGYVNNNYLVGSGISTTVSGTPYTVQVSSGYLALRNAMAYDYSNEIGKLYTGATVYVLTTNTGSSQYWYVYAPSLGLYGYVNKDYLR